MERIGEITQVDGEWLEVTFCRETDCGHCHACMGTKKQAVIRVKGQGRAGDCAVVEMGAATVTKASALAYTIPLAGLLLGMGAAMLMVPQSDAAAGLGALIGMGLSLGVIALTERSRRKDPRWIPQLKEVIPAIPKGGASHGA